MNGIKKDTFKEMNIDSKLNVLFDCSCELNEKLDGQKIRNSLFAFAGGVLGGMIAVIGKWFFYGG